MVLLAFSLGYAKKTPGTLGKHKFSITHEGLLEETQYNRTLTKWAGIKTLYKTRSVIYVGISSYLYHVIPFRFFGSKEDFDSFYDAISVQIDT